MVSVHLDETSVECFLVRGVVQFYKYLFDFWRTTLLQTSRFLFISFPIGVSENVFYRNGKYCDYEWQIGRDV
jgi:hypothetical protein